jgi:type I restriction enzyme S subunit
MVPEGWQRKPIGDVCAAIVDCVNKTAPVVDEPTPYKMIRTTNVRHGRVDTDSVRYVAEKTFRIWTRRGELQDGDIILTREAPVGEVGQLRNADGMFLGQRTMVYRADGELMDQQFLYQTMIGPSLVRQYHADSAGGTVAHIRVPDCSKFVLMVPPLPEQRKIADILSTWDQAIEKTEALLSNARTQKRALMQQLLTGKRRFPAFKGQPWKEVRLGDVVKIDWGNTSITKKSYVDSGVDAYSAAGRDGYVEDAEFSGAGIVLSAIGARCGRCFWADGDWTAIKNTIVIRQQPDHCDLRFLFQIVNDARFWPISGGAQPFIGLKNARNAKVKLPSLREQRRVAEVLNVSDSLIADLVCDITKLRTEKKALMQQLLTGKRRVVV